MPPIPPTPSSIHALSAFLYVMLALSGVGAAVFHWPVLTWAGVGCTVAFLALQFRNVPRFQAIMALVMIAIGLSVGSQSEKVADVLVDGLIKAQLFLVLFFAVAWLQIPAADSPALRAVRRTVVSQPPGWRFLYLAGAGHILGSVLNIAGLVLLSTMVERQTDAGLQRRMASALMQGFVAASIWSPFYVSVIVVLIALPELDWSDAIFHGLPIAAVTVACAWIFDRVVHRRPPPGSSLSGNPQPPGYPLGMRHRINLAGVLGALVVVVVGTVELSGLSLPVVLALVAPPFGVVWMALLAGPGRRWRRGAVRRIWPGSCLIVCRACAMKRWRLLRPAYLASVSRRACRPMRSACLAMVGRRRIGPLGIASVDSGEFHRRSASPRRHRPAGGNHRHGVVGGLGAQHVGFTGVWNDADDVKVRRDLQPHHCLALEHALCPGGHNGGQLVGDRCMAYALVLITPQNIP